MANLILTKTMIIGLILIFAAVVILMTSGSVVVHTSSGYVEGIETDTKWGPLIHFYGIPYAESPLRRFQHSQPILKDGKQQGKLNNNGSVAIDKNFSSPPEETVNVIPSSSKHEYHHHYNPDDDQTKTKKASDIMKIVNSDDSTKVAPCPQPSHLVDFKHPAVPHVPESLNEDCLKLNIYVPFGGENGENFKSTTSASKATNAEKTYPILVWIPGDGFSFGDAIHYDGSALAALGSMIVITVNYRLGVFGFLSFGSSDDSKVAGNAGLSDILSALAWIQENAEAFNGDETKITLGGRFSGSMAISALMSSPQFLKSKNADLPALAQRIILHGGIASTPWVIEANPIEPALKLLSLTNCAGNQHSTTMDERLECLEKLPTDLLLAMSMKVPEMFRPVIDKRLILRDPMQSIYYGYVPENVDFLIGDNSGSGSLCYQRHFYTKGRLLSKIQSNEVNEDDLRALVQEDLNAYFNESDEGLAAIVTHEYLYSTKSTQSFRDVYTHFCGLLFLRNPTETTARYISRFGRNHVYRYELDGQFESEPSTSFPDTPKWLETTIGNEIIFLFPTNEHVMSPAEEIVFQNLTGAYISFVRNGYPGKPWPIFTEDKKKITIFTSEGTKFGSSSYLDQDVHFWRDTFSKVLESYQRLALHSTNRTALTDIINQRPDPFSELCLESIEHHQSFTANATNYFLGFLIFLGCCCIIGLGVFIFKLWKKHRILFR